MVSHRGGRRVSRAAPDLRSWISEHLDPLDALRPVDGRPDRDPDDSWYPPSMPSPTPAAVLIGLVERPEGMTVLLTRRADSLRAHTGQIALPGGRMDDGETPWETALREAREEIGLDPAHVSLAGLATPFLTGTAYLVTPVVGFVAPGFSLARNPDEVAEIFETPFSYLMDLANHEERDMMASTGQLRRVIAVTHEDRVIWGVTAHILRSLYYRLYGAAVA